MVPGQTVLATEGSGSDDLELTMLFMLQVMSADKKASNAAKQAVAATVQPAQEPSTPSIPFATSNSMKTAPAERKSSRAENIFDLAVSFFSACYMWHCLKSVLFQACWCSLVLMYNASMLHALGTTVTLHSA